MPTNLTGVGRILWSPVGEQKGQLVAFSRAVSLITANTLQLEIGHNMESRGSSNSQEVN